jgi:hypothetical protein
LDCQVWREWVKEKLEISYDDRRKKMKKIKILILVFGLCFLGASIFAVFAGTSVAKEAVPNQEISQDPEPLSDLVLDEFTMTPERPRVNEPVTITIQVRNAGAGEGPGWRVNLYVDPPDQPPTSTTPYSKTMAAFIAFPPGATATVELSGYTFAAPGCQHVLYAWADPNEGIPESDETNNMRVIHLCVDPETPVVPGADVYEPDDTCSASVPSISTDGEPQVRSFVPVTDTDYVQFEVTQGVTYTIIAAGTGEDADPNIEISDSCNFALPFGVTARVEFTAPADGTYYLKLTNEAQNPDPNQTTYQLMVQAGTEPPTGDPPLPFAISPGSGVNDANTNVVISGTQFVFPTMAELCLYRSGACSDDCTQLLDTTWVGSQKLYAVVQANLDPGDYCLQLTNPGGKSNRLENAFTVHPAQPDPRDVVPNQGYGDVSTDLHIYGFNFAQGISLAIGPSDLENVKVINGTHVLATLPGGAGGLAPGTYNLTASYSGGTPGELADAFTVLVPQEDLYAQSDELWRDPPMPHAGAPMNLGLVVHRRGGSDLLLDLTVRFFVNGAPIGDAVIPLIAVDGQVNTPYVPYTPPAEGVYTVTATIDPDQTVSESTRANNTVTRTVEVQPANDDTQAPHVDSLTINGGSGQTVDSTDVTLSATATDVGGSGLAEIRYIEFEYNQGAQLWVPVQDSYWRNYTLNHADYAWTLTPVGGIHYIQAWVKDAAGNISHYPYQQYVSYMPPTEGVGRDQVRIYRRTLAVSETLHVTLTPLSGDADLYVWAPDWEEGRPPWVSNLEGNEVDEVIFSAPVAGVYQVEVYGYTSAQYQLNIATGTAAALAPQSSIGIQGFKRWLQSPTGIGEPPKDSDPPTLVPLARVAIGDQAADTGMVNTAYTFTATASFPVTGTISLPITYTWQATDQLSVIETKVSVNSNAVFSWPTDGSKTIIVTAENAEGSVVTYHTVSISTSWQVYLPVVVRGLNF